MIQFIPIKHGWTKGAEGALAPHKFGHCIEINLRIILQVLIKLYSLLLNRKLYIILFAVTSTLHLLDPNSRSIVKDEISNLRLSLSLPFDEMMVFIELVKFREICTNLMLLQLFNDFGGSPNSMVGNIPNSMLCNS